MKLQQLQALVTVVDEGSIRAAARALHLSQAAITKSMRLLEEQAGVPLLHRGSRGVVLTESGHKLLQRARLITRQVHLATEEMRQASGQDRGSVRLGVTPYLTLTGLGEAFSWFRQRYQHVQVQLIEGLMSRVLPRLRDGTLDIAVVATDVGDLRGDEFHRRVLRQVPQAVVVREGHPVLSRPNARALCELEWILTQPLAPERQPQLHAMFDRAGVSPPQSVVVCETLAAMTLMRHSNAVSVMPIPLLGHPETRGLQAVPKRVLQPADIEVLLLHRPDVPLTPAAEFFAHCLTSVSR